MKCPVEGCDHEGLSRGMHLHVRQSSGDGHGPNGDTPENISFDDLEIVGEKDVEMNYPDKQKTGETARLCPFCGKAYRGFRGVKIHLGQKVGQGVHPDDAAELTKEDTPVAKVDEDMNVVDVVDSASLMPSTKRRIEGGDGGSVPKEDVLKFIGELESEGSDDLADRVRTTLLG